MLSLYGKFNCFKTEVCMLCVTVPPTLQRLAGKGAGQAKNRHGKVRKHGHKSQGQIKFQVYMPWLLSYMCIRQFFCPTYYI